MRTFVLVLAGLLVVGCASSKATARKRLFAVEATATASKPTRVAEQQLKAFIDRHVAKVAPLEKELNLAAWDAATSGKPAAYEKTAALELELGKIYADPTEYRFLKELRAKGEIKDHLLARELEVLTLTYEGNQINPALMEQMVRLETEVEQVFNEYRPVVGGKQLTDNDISAILKTDPDPRRREEAWEAYQARGALVRDRVIALARLRNQAARSLGYADYYEMTLRLEEQDPAQLKGIFEALARETDAPFAQMMEKVKRELAQRYNVAPAELMPWHYADPFFQEAPVVGAVDLDTLFENIDLEHLVRDFYKDSDIDPVNILAQSDLYEKPGKMPHAFCTDIDRGQDVRILANLRKSERWASALLHEMGHAVYDKYIDPSLPWLLRSPAHVFTTEAVAELFGRLTRNPRFLQARLKLPAEKVLAMSGELRFAGQLQAIVFARWTLVVTNFERELYRDPEQDLNKLWWELKRRYQLQNVPEGRAAAPDWAAKIHIATNPVYYHNYMLGEMMASQLLHTMARQFTGTDDVDQIDFASRLDFGRFLIYEIFRPGASLRWDELLVRATGETLNPKYFAQQFL